MTTPLILLVRRAVGIGVLLLLLAATAVPAQGQGRRGQQMNPQAAADQALLRLDEVLDLTDEQESRICPLLRKHAEEMRALREQNPDGDREARFERIRAHQEQADKAIEAVLNAEQVKRFRVLREKQRADREARRRQWQQSRN